MAAATSRAVLEILKRLEWATPLKKVNVGVSKIGERGWYRVTEDLFISTVGHDPRSGNYLDDPNGPFVTQIVWTRCLEAISVLVGEANTVKCSSRSKPPSTFLPSKADGTFRDIVESLGAGNYWDRSAYTGDDEFKYRMIASADEAYTYYFSSDPIDEKELPFAVVYLLEGGRTK